MCARLRVAKWQRMKYNHITGYGAERRDRPKKRKGMNYDQSIKID